MSPRIDSVRVFEDHVSVQGLRRHVGRQIVGDPVPTFVQLEESEETNGIVQL